MLRQLEEFRNILDEVMCKCLHNRIILYGNGRSGRFIKWYAKYYHNIDIDYVITLDCTPGRSYEQELFQPSLLSFNYKDTNNCVIWFAEPMDESMLQMMDELEYVKDETYFDFYKLVYGNDYYWEENTETDPTLFHKEGRRDIQFLEWLEWKYECNFVTMVANEHFRVSSGNSYVTSSHIDLFALLNQCRGYLNLDGGIFDFGCGKGGAMMSFLDYGFFRVGGVEMEPAIYDQLEKNVNLLGMDEQFEVELLCGDATTVKGRLDFYSTFYFFDPFRGSTFAKCIDNISESLSRNPRKVIIIARNLIEWQQIEDRKEFSLWAQMSLDSRQRCANIYHNV